MKARAGDRLVVEGTHVDDPQRVGHILEVSHPDGSPPYLVRWEGSDEESLVFPGPDAHIDRESGVG